MCKKFYYHIFTENGHGAHGDFEVQILDYCDANDKEWQKEIQLQWTTNILKDKEKNISLTKDWMTISIQKISSIHKLILTIQQILGSHELKGHGHF